MLATTNKNSAGTTTTALYTLFSAPTTLEASSGQGDTPGNSLLTFKTKGSNMCMLITC
ncbi:hypothetical protein HETIRDRAFT_163165 [Heterobasidion irregulare TC 32-1]|uniref:Uncharacterized protein n=1 Tax=Heterobasidion irregulare (strain TC 32-1) TaxID=747525 RepID=W4KBL7_HETIT|nr:uncharacterized protein HETIRDRAFT_163165 [Heterobasidion irregulare TC 32-1]ETW82740.1 hypothetical protein HETIRDRAFT_163165 [Heterobasidion irregulare TC 32-1]